MLAQLADHGDLSVIALARPFAMSLSAIMKHREVLSEAGLIARSKMERTVICRLAAASMDHGDGMARRSSPAADRTRRRRTASMPSPTMSTMAKRHAAGQRC